MYNQNDDALDTKNQIYYKRLRQPSGIKMSFVALLNVKMCQVY